MNSPDIKPIRSETLANRKRRNIGGSSLLFISFLGLINIVGLVVLGLWFFNSSGYQQEVGQGFIARISMLEEKFSTEENINKELIKSLEEEVNFLNKEIRKLWDISNKKNKKNIAKLLEQVKELEKNDNDLTKKGNTFAAQQRAMDLEIAKLEKAQEKFRDKLRLMDSLSKGSDIEKRINSQEQAVEAFDAYRKQINKTLFELQSRINELQIRIEDSL